MEHEHNYPKLYHCLFSLSFNTRPIRPSLFFIGSASSKAVTFDKNLSILILFQLVYIFLTMSTKNKKGPSQVDIIVLSEYP